MSVIVVTTHDAITASNAKTIQNTNSPTNPGIVNGPQLPSPAPNIYMVDEANVVGNTVQAGSLMVNVTLSPNGPTVTIIETTKPIVIV
ncbi:MAG: hypothetical protein ACK5JL_03660 [Candidatus Kapaibacterium sp.]|jgi:hypothetical protein